MDGTRRHDCAQAEINPDQRKSTQINANQRESTTINATS
jgi:hypothetical protein